MLAGLWEFPHVEGALDEAAVPAVLADWGLTPQDWKRKLNAKHVFTHVEWRMTAYLMTGYFEDDPNRIMANAEELIGKFAIPSAFSAYIKPIKKGI